MRFQLLRAAFIESVYQSLDAIPHVQDMEVEQEANPFVGQAHVRKKLSWMYRVDSADRFHLDDNLFLDKQVQAKACIESDSTK